MDTTEKNDGGPAFPSEGIATAKGYTQSAGMTLRDWLAGQALAGGRTGTERCKAEDHAYRAYRIADAMLAERDES